MATLYCKHAAGRYVALGLKFKDGKASVSEEKLAEVKKSAEFKKGEIFIAETKKK